VSVADGIPLDLVGNFTSVSRADLPDDEAGRVQVELTRVGEDYFETIGTPVLRGRGIERTDDHTSDPVVVLTESLAARLWPGEEVLGRRIRSSVMRGGPEEFTVVGVVPEVASSRSTESWPNIFVAARQKYRPRVMIAIRGTGDPGTLIRPIQSAILSVDPGLSFPTVVSSESLVARSTQSQRASAGIAGALGLLALLLSAIGVYGVVAFAVTRRTREIGLRMAVGASRGKVLRDVLRDAVSLAIPGLAVGVVLAAGTAAAFRSELFGLSPLDPVSFGAAAGALFVVILLASLVPARRASGIDPMAAMRRE
jgi:putative ABC transport system permease protein